MRDPFNETYALSVRARYFLILLICMVIVIAVYWQVILPQSRELIVSRQQGKQLNTQLQHLLYQEMSLEEIMVQFPGTKSALDEGQKKFIKYDDRDKLLKEMIAIARRDHLQVNLSYAGLAVNENNYIRQPCKIVATGDYPHMSRLIEQIANLPWTVVVKNFSIARLASSDIYSGVMEVDVYYMKETARQTVIQ